MVHRKNGGIEPSTREFDVRPLRGGGPIGGGIISSRKRLRRQNCACTNRVRVLGVCVETGRIRGIITNVTTNLGESVYIIVPIFLPPLVYSLQDLVGIVVFHELLLSLILHLFSLVMVGVPLLC